ncbi:MAG: hypothetical protein D6732_19500 [Methanobacteriota archaeon]|nr:MAG: hypothetical protein D6732_19500 [Euryarchaeota archaeon]
MVFDNKQFRNGLLTGIGITVAILILVWILWIAVYPKGSSFPVSLVTFGSAGILFTLAGCIGPGRYRKVYDIILYYPRSGSSYYNKVVISAFTAKDHITKATLIANGNPIEEIEFKGGVFEKEYTIKDFGGKDVVELELLAENGTRSNKSLVTFYDIMDFSDEELVEIESNPLQIRRLTVKEGRDEYLKSLETNILWFSIGVFLVGVAVGMSIIFF